LILLAIWGLIKWAEKEEEREQIEENNRRIEELRKKKGYK
jgi:hypothetical protein